jgi:hypothetical protein
VTNVTVQVRLLVNLGFEPAVQRCQLSKRGIWWMASRVWAPSLSVKWPSTNIFSLLAVDCVAHLTATAMFESMIVRSGSQSMALATFTSNYNQALTVGGDATEAHRFTMEVVSGVFNECHKVRSRAADRTLMVYSVADAGRSMWAALQTIELLGGMIVLKYTGHP